MGLPRVYCTNQSCSEFEKRHLGIMDPDKYLRLTGRTMKCPVCGGFLGWEPESTPPVSADVFASEEAWRRTVFAFELIASIAHILRHGHSVTPDSLLGAEVLKFDR